MKIKNIVKITLSGVVILGTAALTPVYGATDTFAQFGPNVNKALNVMGEATDPMFKGGIAVKEFSFGAENTMSISAGTAGAGAGKTKLNSLVIKKSVDKTSPVLFQALAMGSHYPDLTLSVRKSGGTGKGAGAYYVLKFTTVFVTKISVSNSSGDDQATEEVTLTYGAVEETYMPQDPTGAPDPAKAVKGMWNQMTNKGEGATGP